MLSTQLCKLTFRIFGSDARSQLDIDESFARSLQAEFDAEEQVLQPFPRIIDF